ncbi:MAG: galactosyldiacylglycerol synthase [Ignavibacteria bacterium]|nr:MAG: galactosyldiacylglycerol synthase [Ignavibacteria bacterium]
MSEKGAQGSRPGPSRPALRDKRDKGGRRRRKTILIVSATVGAGHVRAGEALLAAAESLSRPVTISHADVLDFTFPLFKKLYSDSYYEIVQRSPELWGYLYKKSDSRKPLRGKAGLIRLFDHFNFKKYLKELSRLKPDAVICTHFLPYLAIEDEISQKGWQIPFFAVPTDYDVHSLWVSRAVSRYYAATEEAACSIQTHGIPPENIGVSGIPIMPQFGIRLSRQAARKRLGIPSGHFTILILSGGYGIGVVDELTGSVARFLATDKRRDYQLIVVCGKNPGLYGKLSRMAFPANVRARLFEYITFIDQTMACSDLVITKAGGLTVSEALARHLPLLILDPFPGQEGRNADYLIEHGAAISAHGFENLHYKLHRLIEEPGLLSAMKKRAAELAKPHAARDILKDVLGRL